MKTLLLILFLLHSTLLFSNEKKQETKLPLKQYKVKKVYAKNKFSFSFKKQNSIPTKVFLYIEEKLVGFAKPVKCKKTLCLAIVNKRLEPFDRVELDFILTNRETTLEELENLEEPSKPSSRLYNGKIGLGGLFSSSLFLALERKFPPEKFTAYVDGGIISSTISESTIKGSFFGIGGRYFFYDWKDFHFFGQYELELALLEIEIPGIVTTGVIINENVFANIFAVGADYPIMNNIDISLSAGLSYNSLKNSYENSYGGEFTLPYAGALLFYSVFVSYTF